MLKLKITTIGNSAGVVLPKELLARFRLEKGDELSVSEGPDGFTLAPHDPAFDKKMDVAERIMREDRDLLRRLSKN